MLDKCFKKCNIFNSSETRFVHIPKVVAGGFVVAVVVTNFVVVCVVVAFVVPSKRREHLFEVEIFSKDQIGWRFFHPFSRHVTILLVSLISY